MYSYAAWLTLYNRICQHKYYIKFVNGYKQISCKYVYTITCTPKRLLRV